MKNTAALAGFVERFLSAARVVHLKEWLGKRWGIVLGAGAVLLMIVVTQTGASSATEKTPALANAPSEAGYVVQVLLALVVVLAVIVGAAWLMRRVTGLRGAPGSAIRILGGISVSPRDRMVLVQVGEQQLLVGVSPGRLQTLLVLDKPVVIPTTPSSRGFDHQLAQAIRRRTPE